MTAPSEVHPLVGVWALVPEHSRYAGVEAPSSGVLTVLAEGDALWFHARWRDAGGTPREVPFRRLDGALPALEEDGSVLRVVEEPHVEAVYRRSSAKQVLVYRRDLKMRKGKIAAQCAHASMAVFFRRGSGPPGHLALELDGPMAAWVRGRFTKVVLSVEGEDELLRVHEQARRAGLPAVLITDAGRTEFRGVPTRTAVAVGPAERSEVDAITGPGGVVACKLA